MSKLKYFDGTNWNEVGGKIAGDTLPIGAIVPFGGWDAPTGWLICDGTLLNKTAYPELFNAIGYSFGGEEGGSTFGLPDLRGKVPVGIDENDTDFDGMGITGGSKDLQEHNHGTLKISSYSGGVPGSKTGYGYQEIALDRSSYGSTTDTAGTGNSGNLQPYQTVNYIIKAKQSAGLVANVSNTYSTSQTNTYSCDYTNNIINNIIDSGSNANGSYIKFPDGTMICYKTISGIVDITNSTMSSTMYYGSVYLGEPAVNFIARPTITVTLQAQTGTQGFLSTNGNTGSGTATDFGYVTIIRPDSRTGYAYILDVIAIGRWK